MRNNHPSTAIEQESHCDVALGQITGDRNASRYCPVCGAIMRYPDLRVTIRQGPFEFGSIFAKTLKKMLDEGQLARRGTK